MKGISAIIAMVLILMIVVALTGLAYTWFTGIFGSLTTSATNATTTATTAMGMQVRIEAAKINSTTAGKGVNATIRNIGTVDIDVSKLGVYIDGSLCSTYNPNTGKLTPSLTATLQITNTTAACTNKVLKITLESGFEDYKTITC